MPPNVCRRLAARGLLRSDKPRRHVRYAVHLFVVERVVAGILRIPEDVVVLGAPAALRARPVVVRPDDLVHERRTPEYAVEHDLAVVHLSEVDMEKERARRLQHPVRLLHPRPEKTHEVVVRVVVSV